MNYTPGPWEAADLDRELFPHVFIGPELLYSDGSGRFRAMIIVNDGPTPEDVAAGHGYGSTLETCRANARLIAAAPDLLEALKECLSCEFAVTDKAAIEKARSAIAKAEGR